MNATYLQFRIENPYTGDFVVLNDVSTDPSNYYTISESPDFKLGVRNSNRNRLGRHFIKSFYSFYAEREINFKGQIIAQSKQQMENLVDDLRKVLALPPLPTTGNDGFVIVKWTDANGRDWQCNAKISDDVKIVSSLGLPYLREYEINLICEDGLVYSQDLFSVSGITSYYAGSLLLPCHLPVSIPNVWWNEVGLDNDGNFYTPPLIRIYGYAENPKVELTNTGDFIKLDGYTIPAGSYVEIDVANGTIELDDGTDLSGYLSTDSVWFYLESGNNVLRLTHDGSYLLGSIMIYWRDATI